MKSLEQYLNLPYHITMVRSEDEDGYAAWVASVEELPGCISQGETPEEAATMIREAMELWIEVGLSHGDAIPEPRDPDSYKGQFMVRLPSGLHRALDRSARQEGVSLNHLVGTILAGGLGWSPTQEGPSGPRGRAPAAASNRRGRSTRASKGFVPAAAVTP